MSLPYGPEAAWTGHAFVYSADDDGTEGPVEAFAPDAHTVAEVLEHARQQPAEIPLLLAAERAGKQRSTLIASLEKMSEEDRR